MTREKRPRPKKGRTKTPYCPYLVKYSLDVLEKEKKVSDFSNTDKKKSKESSTKIDIT